MKPNTTITFPLTNQRGQHTGRTFRAFRRNAREILDLLPAGWSIPGLSETLDADAETSRHYNKCVTAATELVEGWGREATDLHGQPSGMTRGIAALFTLGCELIEDRLGVMHHNVRVEVVDGQTCIYDEVAMEHFPLSAGYMHQPTFDGIKEANKYWYRYSKRNDVSLETRIQSWADRAGLAILKPAPVAVTAPAISDAAARLLAVGFTPEQVAAILLAKK